LQAAPYPTGTDHIKALSIYTPQRGKTRLEIINSSSVPDLLQAKRILCIQPHYDDNDIAAGGTLAGLHDLGTEIIYLTVTDDLIGITDPFLPAKEATIALRKEQIQAGEIIGVDQLYWLNFPDAGDYNYYKLRQQIIQHIRLVKPDFLLTVDPWLPYEAHRDHIQTGLAAAEAALLQNMVRLKTDYQIDNTYSPYDITGVIFGLTNSPNITVDISEYQKRKHLAIDSYKMQFTQESMTALHTSVEREEKICAKNLPFKYGESFKILRPEQLHINIHSWKS